MTFARVATLVTVAALAISLLPAVAHAAPINCGDQSGTRAMIRVHDSSNDDHDNIRILGNIKCQYAMDILTLRCWVVHRHTFNWHSHEKWKARGGEVDKDHAHAPGPGFRRYFLDGRYWSRGFHGTPGDTYKTHCAMHVYEGDVHRTYSKESRTVTFPH
ncbi:MAG: hypothetical protein H0V19_01975 [Euzebyales bacterium]|nr:hypothetical protein [Euzebyales bacterium]